VHRVFQTKELEKEIVLLVIPSKLRELEKMDEESLFLELVTQLVRWKKVTVRAEIMVGIFICFT
jgi:hypothetical protein